MWRLVMWTRCSEEGHLAPCEPAAVGSFPHSPHLGLLIFATWRSRSYGGWVGDGSGERMIPNLEARGSCGAVRQCHKPADRLSSGTLP